MFIQVILAIMAANLIYLGVTDGSILNIIAGAVLVILTLGRFYAAMTGSSLLEKFEQWRKQSALEKR